MNTRLLRPFYLSTTRLQVLYCFQYKLLLSKSVPLRVPITLRLHYLQHVLPLHLTTTTCHTTPTRLHSRSRKDPTTFHSNRLGIFLLSLSGSPRLLFPIGSVSLLLTSMDLLNRIQTPYHSTLIKPHRPLLTQSYLTSLTDLSLTSFPTF